MSVQLIRVKSSNNKFGGVRRGWLVVSGEVLKFVDEMWMGADALGEYKDEPVVATVEVSPNTYRSLRSIS